MFKMIEQIVEVIVVVNNKLSRNRTLRDMPSSRTIAYEFFDHYDNSQNALSLLTSCDFMYEEMNGTSTSKDMKIE